VIEHIAGVVLTAALHQTIQPTVVPTWQRISQKYQDNRYEKFRRCVVKRESEGIPTARNRRSGAAGLYQFMPAWRPSLVRRLHIPQYRHTDIHHWPANIQTAGFWLVLDHGLGARNWSGGRYDCTHLLP
jgi:hypothetical protein